MKPKNKKNSASAPFLQIPTRAPQQLGQALGRFRKRAGLSQATLGVSAGLRQATVSRIEQGLGTTSIKSFFAACAALELELVVRPRGTGKEDLDLEQYFGVGRKHG